MKYIAIDTTTGYVVAYGITALQCILSACNERGYRRATLRNLKVMQWDIEWKPKVVQREEYAWEGAE